MRLHVRHHTEYRFTESQARLVQLLRLTPVNFLGQSIVAWNIEVDRDTRLKPARDGHGNETTMLYIDGPIERIAITVTGEALTEDRAGVVEGAPEPLPPLYYLQPTALTAADPAVADFAAAFAGHDSLTRAHDLAGAIEARIAPVAPDATLDHHAAAVFASGTADAQGATHLLIAAARAAGLPARYVAGHLYRPGLEDAQAAHGWAELHVEGYGWIGFDPLEGRCPTDTYLRVATGLDHAQAAPVSGARIGGGAEVLSVDVHVGPQPRQD